MNPFAIPVIGPWLQKWLSTLVAVAGVAGCIALGFMLLVEKADNRHLRKESASLAQQHELDIRDLAQARTNADQLKAALDQVRTALEAKAAADAAKLAETTAALKAAQAETAAARRKSDKILATPADLNAVDAAVLESLK